jgi:hypothetical protein
MTPTTTTAADNDLDRLASQLVALVAAAPGDPLMKPFAAILAAAKVSAIAADGKDAMRLKVAAAFVTVLRGLAPEFVLDIQDDPAPFAH